MVPLSVGNDIVNAMPMILVLEPGYQYRAEWNTYSYAKVVVRVIAQLILRVH